MVDNKHKCIFIHITKTGGSSINKSLGNTSSNHSLWHEYKKDLGKDVWDEYFKFTTVRNLWDRAVSYYNYDKHINYLNKNVSNFRDYVLYHNDLFNNNNKIQERFKPIDGIGYEIWHFGPQLDWVLDDKENVTVDYIMRFENLKEDFKYVCKKIGKEFSLPHENNLSNRPHYCEYYDDDTKEIIRKWSQKDLDYFGYKFEK